MKCVPWSKVVKIDMTCPFCIGSHVNIHLDMSIAFVAFVNTNVGKSLVTISCPCYKWWLKTNFGYQSYDNQKILVAIFWLCHCGLAIYMYMTYGLFVGKCNIMFSLNKSLCKIPQWCIAFIMFMNAHANFTWFCLKVTSCVRPFIFNPPYRSKVQLSIMGEYFVL
jgi:hypothetical protein